MTQKKENPLYTLAFSIILPTVVLNKFSDADSLGPQKALMLAIAFPLLYGAFDYLRRRQHNVFAAIGLAGVAISGGLGLLKMDGFWFAVKEAAIPSVLGLVVMASSWMKKPLISKILLNDELIHLEKLHSAVAEKGVDSGFSRLLNQTNSLFALSFFVSAVLNFALAIFLLKSPAGSTEFNQELAKMNALSFVVISVPTIAFVLFSMWYFFNKLNGLVGLSANDVLRSR